MIEKLHNINGKLDLIQDLKLHDLKLSLDQQEALLNIHQQLLDQRNETLVQIKKQYIISYYEISNKFFCNLQPTSLSSAIREDLWELAYKI